MAAWTLLSYTVAHSLERLNALKPLPSKLDCALCNIHILQRVHLHFAMMDVVCSFIVKYISFSLKYFGLRVSGSSHIAS